MRKIIFVPTWRCNLKCEYCDYSVNNLDKGYIVKAFDNSFFVNNELKWSDWVKYLSRFEPFLLEMTGGEPTLYPELDLLLNHIGRSCKWAITSNSLNHEMIHKLPYDNCISWTASYHYHSNTEFIGNLAHVRNQGVNVRVTLVFTPDNYKQCIEAIHTFVPYFGINLHPMLKQGFSWENHRDIWNTMQGYSGGRVIFVGNISDKWQPDRYEKCDAGDKYFALMPDGMVRRCYSHIMTDKNEGHIREYVPNGEKRECNIECCFPCDKDIAKVCNQ
jgi:MoaA/NifB/PqqE/SkfB family radical SAM enzyme